MVFDLAMAHNSSLSAKGPQDSEAPFLAKLARPSRGKSAPQEVQRIKAAR